jgi:hypothetical protein
MQYDEMMKVQYYFETMKFRMGSIIVKEGTPINHIFIIAHGEVEVKYFFLALTPLAVCRRSSQRQGEENPQKNLPCTKNLRIELQPQTIGFLDAYTGLNLWVLRPRHDREIMALHCQKHQGGYYPLCDKLEEF